jgi:hypothetical protein
MPLPIPGGVLGPRLRIGRSSISRGHGATSSCCDMSSAGFRKAGMKSVAFEARLAARKMAASTTILTRAIVPISRAVGL